MKAIVQKRYGPVDEVLHLRDVPRPAVGDDEALVRVRAASVHPDIWHMVTGRPFILRLMGAGLRRPNDTTPGTDLAGTVEEVGKNVTEFSPGDDVFGESRRGMGWRNGGTFADYVSVPQDLLALKPGNITFEQAAAVPTAGIIALHNFQIGRGLRAGQHVLVNGAGGGVGSMAVQLARAYGARVTGVDGPDKLDMVRSLGANHVVDYTREDFTRGTERYDLIFDVASNLSLSDCRRALTPAGTYVFIGHDHFGKARGRILGSLPRALGLMALSPFVRQLPTPDWSNPRQSEAMAALKRFIEAGQLTPVVDRTFPLGEVRDAMRYLVEGHARGKVVVIP
jgi:NADPH:quinone reductase-like Zn-dependent oxidoreductase